MKSISISAPLSFLLQGECRLDATFYTSAVFQARKVLDDCEKKGITIRKLSDYSNGTYNPPPIKRIFTDDTERGTPYMLPQEMFDFYWEPRKYVLAHKMDGIRDWYLHPNWIVLTQSGTVGKPYYASTIDTNIVLSQNAIRIPPADEQVAGFVYAYLSTWIGQTLLKKDEFGITVKHIRPHHVDSIPIPDIPKDAQLEIAQKVKRAFELRGEAIQLLRAAKLQIYNQLGAPHHVPLEDEEGSVDED